jgi:hypothetical protein
MPAEDAALALAEGAGDAPPLDAIGARPDDAALAVIEQQQPADGLVGAVDRGGQRARRPQFDLGRPASQMLRTTSGQAVLKPRGRMPSIRMAPSVRAASSSRSITSATVHSAAP